MASVLIAGGGIAGMAAALGFARAGWDVTICEQARAFGEVGAGLQMSPNAVRVLDWLGVLGQVRAVAFEPEAAHLRDGVTGATVFRAPLGIAAQDRWGMPYLHVHRADLLDALLSGVEAAGVAVEFGVRAERTVARTHGVGLHTDDGRIREADLVIGADGIRSRLRTTVNPQEAPRFTGQVAWRGLVPVEALPRGTIPPDATVWAGDRRHLVTYYVRGGRLVNLVGVLEREEWAEEGWSVPGDPDELRAAFAGWHPAVTALLAEVRECFLWGLFDRPEQVRWTVPGLALIGDAAHPMLPFMAQGAAQALEDVAALVRHAGDGSDVNAALAAWEEERWHRVARIIAGVAANGRLFHRPPGFGRWRARTPIRLASRFAPDFAAGRLDWLYRYDPVHGTDGPPEPIRLG